MTTVTSTAAASAGVTGDDDGDGGDGGDGDLLAQLIARSERLQADVARVSDDLFAVHADATADVSYTGSNGAATNSKISSNCYGARHSARFCLVGAVTNLWYTCSIRCVNIP